MATGTPVGILLQRYRTAAGVTQERLAEQAGLSARGISDIERGLKPHPHAHTLRRLAEALELTPSDRNVFLESARAEYADRETAPSTISRPPIGGFLGALPIGPLVERAAEMECIASALEAVQEGSGRFVLISGEPGVGKTRLMQEATLLLQNRNFTIAVGRCYSSDEEVPYCPFLQVLASLHASAPKQVQVDLLRRWPLLIQLASDGVQAPPLPPIQADEQHHMLRAITHFIRTIAGCGPVALLLDDLQWADRSSLRLLLHLARFTRDSHVLLIGAYRDEDIVRPHALDEILLEIHRDGLEDRLRLQRLTETGTRGLIEATCEPIKNVEALAHFLHARSAGNAFFTQELLHAIMDQRTVPEMGASDVELPDELEVPDTVRAVILQRLAQLSATSQEILYEACVLGQAFAFDVLVGMSGRIEDAVESTLEESRLRGLVRMTGRDSYAFNHALTWQALYGEVSPRRKRRLHRAAARALRSDHTAAEVLWHLLEAGDTHEALPVAILAGDQAAAIYAHDQAVRHYDMALTLAHKAGDRRAEAAALEKVGPSLEVLGRSADALAALASALRIKFDLDDPEAAVRTAACIGRVHASQGTFAEGIRTVESLIKVLEDRSRPPLLAELHAVHGHLLQENGRYLEALVSVERAEIEAGANNGPALLAEIEHVRIATLWELGRHDWDLPIWVDRVEQAESSGDLRALLHALRWAYLACRYRGDLRASKDFLARGVEAHLQMEDGDGAVFWLSRLGYTALLMGDTEEAGAALDRAQLLNALHENETSLWLPLDLGVFALHTGDRAKARGHLQASLAIAQRIGQLDGLRVSQLWLARLDLIENDPESAIGRLVPHLDRPGMEEFKVTELLPTLAVAHLTLGHNSEAHQLADASTRRARAQHNRFDLAAGLSAEGRNFSAAKNWPQAEQAFSEALSLVRSMPYPYAEVAILMDWGAMSVSAGDDDKAEAKFRSAANALQRIGADPGAPRGASPLIPWVAPPRRRYL